MLFGKISFEQEACTGEGMQPESEGHLFVVSFSDRQDGLFVSAFPGMVIVISRKGQSPPDLFACSGAPSLLHPGPL